MIDASSPISCMLPGSLADHYDRTSAPWTSTGARDYLSGRRRRGRAGLHALFDHVVRPPQHRRRDDKTKRLCRLQIDRQLKPHRLLDGQVRGLAPWRILAT